MRSGIVIDLTSADRERLERISMDRNTPQKHVWRAEIVLLSADRVGTSEIMRRTGTSKTCVWRWQERFMQEGAEGLLRDKTRPSRKRHFASMVARMWTDKKPPNFGHPDTDQKGCQVSDFDHSHVCLFKG